MNRFASFLTGILLLVALSLPAAAGEFKEGDNAFGATYSYASPDLEYNDREANLGLSFEHWIVDDLSVDVEAWSPRSSRTREDLSGSVQLDYHFGPFYVPLQVAYWNDVDSVAFGAGAGVNFLGGPINLRFQGTVHYLEDRDLPDRTAYQATGAVRFRF